jgi:hypothetical protein
VDVCSDMTPGTSLLNGRDAGPTDAKAPSQSALALLGTAYPEDGALGEDGLRMCASDQCRSIPVSVDLVVGTGAPGKVAGVEAGGVVAGAVSDNHPLRWGRRDAGEG